MLANYAELIAEVADWLNREDLTSKIPTFIRLLEAQLNRDVRVREMQKRSYTNILTGVAEPEFIALPADYLAMMQVQIGTPRGPKVLDFVSAHELDGIKLANGNVAGEPIAFSIVGDEIELAPRPDSAYELEIIYYAEIPPLSETNTVNWMLSQHPDIYLYGTLMKAAPYLHNDERIPVWSNEVTKMLEDMRIANERARFGSTPLKARIKPLG